MSHLFQIDIPRRNFKCSNDQEKFEQGMEYQSVLIDDPDDGIIRHDYCPNCWESIDFNSDEFHIQWKSQVPIRKKENLNRKEIDDRAFEMLREALSDSSLEAAQEAFILAMFLKREKYLQLKQEIEEDDKLADLYEVVTTEEMLIVPKVKVSKIDVETIQNKIAVEIYGKEEEPQQEEPVEEEPADE